MTHSNPYYNIGGIVDPASFLDRTDAVRTALDTLVAGPPQCLSILGQRKIGKTSLVLQLSRAKTLCDYHFDQDSCLFVYLDCQKDVDALNCTEDIYELLHNYLTQRLMEHFGVPSQRFLSDIASASSKLKMWEDCLKKLEREGISVVVVFDEFEKAIVRESLIKGGFFGTLRGLSQHNSNFAWVTCTSRPLLDLFEESFEEYGISKMKRRSESDFYNVAIPAVVGLFSEADILSLITAPARARGITFTPDDMEVIIRLGGRFPYFVQRACNHFFNAYVGRRMQPKEILQQCISEFVHLWRNFWEKLSYEQRDLLASTALEQVSGESGFLLEGLKEASLVYVDDKENAKPFSEEFGCFVISLTKSRKTFSTLQPGQYLGDRYEIRACVGETNHSSVVKAWDRELRRMVAIKLLRVEKEADSELVSRLPGNLVREARILATLKHPNIGQVYDVIQAPLGIVMEWVNGQPLGIPEAGKSRSVTTILKIGIVLAEVLTYIHAHHIIHRDIKPNNIIITPPSEPVLIDFDIARSQDEETISLLNNGLHAFVGTGPYSSPEQLRTPGGVDCPSDVFSLGVVLYELLTGQRPYPVNHPAYFNGHLPRPEQHSIPDALYTILCSAIEEDPVRRPTAIQLRDQLKSFLGDWEAGHGEE